MPTNMTVGHCRNATDTPTLVRLPMYYDLAIEDVEQICNVIKEIEN